MAGRTDPRQQVPRLLAALALVFLTGTAPRARTLAAAPAVGGISSRFDTDSDSWLTTSGSVLTYQATGGNPGGHILGATVARDTGGAAWSVRAPSKFLGDQSRYFGSQLAFDVKPDWSPTSLDGLVLSINSAVAGGALKSFTLPQPGGWTRVSVTLDSSGGWAFGGDEAHLRGVLASLSDVTIVVSAPVGSVTHLDNVVLGGTDQPLRFVESPTQVLPSVLHRQQPGGGQYPLRFRTVLHTLTVELDRGVELPRTGTISARVTAASETGGSGHIEAGHLPPRPHGWLFPLQGAVPNNATLGPRQAGGSLRSDPLTVTLNRTTRRASFRWLPPEAAGIENLEVTLPRVPLSGAARAQIQVMVPGLEELLPQQSGEPPFLLVGGVAGLHQQNHFALPDILQAIKAAAGRYQALQQSSAGLQSLRLLIEERGGALDESVLEINDLSLPWGGLFDVDGSFAAPYGGHRNGDQALIRTILLVADSRNPHGNGVPGMTTDRLLNRGIRQAHELQFDLMVRSLREAGGRLVPLGNGLEVTFLP